MRSNSVVEVPQHIPRMHIAPCDYKCRVSSVDTPSYFGWVLDRIGDNGLVHSDVSELLTDLKGNSNILSPKYDYLFEDISHDFGEAQLFTGTLLQTELSGKGRIAVVSRSDKARKIIIASSNVNHDRDASLFQKRPSH